MQNGMCTGHNAVDETCYQIKVKGVLNPSWSERFGGLQISSSHGETILTGPVIDQAALHGLLIQIRDLGLPLLLVKLIKPISKTKGSSKQSV